MEESFVRAAPLTGPEATAQRLARRGRLITFTCLAFIVVLSALRAAAPQLSGVGISVLNDLAVLGMLGGITVWVVGALRVRRARSANLKNSRAFYDGPAVK